MTGNHYYNWIKVLSVLEALYSKELLLDCWQVMLQEKNKVSKEERAQNANPHPNPHAYPIDRTPDKSVINLDDRVRDRDPSLQRHSFLRPEN